MEPLVSTAWLGAALAKGTVAVLDASLHLPSAERDAAAEFVREHIPGARFLDIATLTDRNSPVPSALPSPTQFAARLADLGVPPEARIVFYDDSAVRSAARAWFMARRAGIEAAILDGGLGKWKAEGRLLESGDAHASARSARQPGPTGGAVRDKSEMLANCASRAEQVVDARDGGRFSGAVADAVHGLPGGHIPGARNLPFTRLFAADGTYKPQEELAEEFRRAGLDLDRPIIASCGSGVTASVLLFALHLLGHSDNALYDGSWSEWGADPATPKETGEARP